VVPFHHKEMHSGPGISVNKERQIDSDLKVKTRKTYLLRSSRISSWYVRNLSPGGKERPGREADHSPSSSAEVKNE
jgi:hypothetical protein